MMRAFFPVLLAMLAVAGCTAGGGGIGDSCGGNGDCGGDLQCLNSRCTPRCGHAPECGDGYRCADGMCIAAHNGAGDSCSSEVDCVAGLSCQISGGAIDPKTNRPIATCTQENSTAPAGAACASDQGCRNGTCELGHCVDLCREDIDCPVNYSCMTLPRVAASGALFSGCLPSRATLTWTIPVTSPSAEILLPIPSGAESAELMMTVDDPGQLVGVQKVLDPCGCTRYTVPCPFGPTPGPGQQCTPTIAGDQFYSQGPSVSIDSTLSTGGASICPIQARCDEDGAAGINHLRHLPALGHSVLLMPAIPRDNELKLGAYQIDVSSFWSDNTPGTAIPRVSAVVRIGTGSALDLHFFFLDQTGHPCSARTDNAALSAGTARQAAYFQDYLAALHAIFNRVGIDVSAASYDDLAGQPDLDSLDVTDVGSLFALGRYSTGINVFFVRSMSPLGLEVFGPNPGPAGLPRTPDSGIAISVDTLCYRDWTALAQLTAHAIARYMGLSHNVEPKDPSQASDAPAWQDLIPDSDLSPGNLMYYAGRGGTLLSPGQGDALVRSGVLR